jgi:hypothetical protein
VLRCAGAEIVSKLVFRTAKKQPRRRIEVMNRGKALTPPPRLLLYSETSQTKPSENEREVEKQLRGELSMYSRQECRSLASTLVATVAMCLAIGATAAAQDTSGQLSSRGTPTVKTQVDSGEVVYVSGNDLLVKMEDGSVRHFVVPDSQRFNVDGGELSVHELKPGIRLQRTIVTTTTPELVTTIRTIKGKVWWVNPPSKVVLQLGDGTNKPYTVPENQTFNIGGQEKTVFDLRQGMEVTATVVTQVPQKVVAQTSRVTGKMPPPATPPMEGVLLIEEEVTPAPVEVANAEPAPAQPTTLPPTSSSVPLIELLGALMLSTGLGLRLIRVRAR